MRNQVNIQCWIITYHLSWFFFLEYKISAFLQNFIIKFLREIRYDNNEGRGRHYLQ